MSQYMPTIGRQLLEPITGRFDCGCYAGAASGDADTLGQMIFTGRQVRLATDEPVPDPQSPGTNNRQVDEALFKLSNGRINLDTQWRCPWSRVETFLKSGRWALLSVVRGPIVDAGFGGSDKFRGAHGITIGYDQARKKFVFLDALLGGGPRDIPSSVLKAAASVFMLRNGGGAEVAGTAYVSFTRDVFPEPSAPKFSVAFKKGASFFDYVVNPVTLKITGRASRKFTKDTSAPCDPVRLVAWPGKDSRRLTRIRAGVLVGSYVEPGAFGVRLVKG